MAGGAYVALSGLQSRLDQLDRLASDIANSGTSGYKGSSGTDEAAVRSPFAAQLESAVDVVAARPSVDFRPGAIAATGRDLDLAIEGRGFFAIQTPAGTRYTRNGHFTRRADGVLETEDGAAVLGDSGPIQLPPGKVEVDADGTIRAGGVVAGKTRLVEFADTQALVREDGARFRPVDKTTPGVATGATLRGGALEQSNVSLVTRMAQLTEVSRSFESLQRGVSVLMNDIDLRAITELGRR